MGDISKSQKAFVFHNFRKEAPENVKSSEKTIKNKKRKKIERKERKQKEGEGQHR
jgi:hypothetical protein